MTNGKIDRLTSNLVFSAFFFSTLGWGLFEILLFQQGAGIRPHLIVTLMGGAISAIALRRCRVWWPRSGSSGFGMRALSDRYVIRDLFSFLALAGAGALVGLSAKSGSCFLFVLCIAGSNLLPWSRISFCQRHFLISNAVLTSSAGAVLISGGALLAPFLYAFDAWVLWTIAVSTALVTYRKPGAPTVEPHVIAQSAEDVIMRN